MAQLQVRFAGRAEIKAGSDACWKKLQQDQRDNYGVNPAPGTMISGAGDYNRIADVQRFAILLIQVSKLDIVHLSPDFHRRARFTGNNNWRGQWLSP